MANDLGAGIECDCDADTPGRKRQRAVGSILARERLGDLPAFRGEPGQRAHLVRAVPGPFAVPEEPAEKRNANSNPVSLYGLARELSAGFTGGPTGVQKVTLA